MTISAKCVSCEREYQVRDEFAGRSVPCKSCGAIFHVPRTGDADGPLEVSEFVDDAWDDYDDYRRPANAAAQSAPPPPQQPRPQSPRPQSPRPQSARPQSPRPQSARPQSARPQSARPQSARPRPKPQPPRTSARARPTRAPRGARKTSGAGKGVLIGVGIGAAVLAVGLGAFFAIRSLRKGADPAAPEDGFNVKDAEVPNFPDLPRGRTLRGGERVCFLDLGQVPGNGSGPGEQMKMRVYLPPGDHAAKSLGCVLVAPAGTTLLHGNDLDDDNYHKETLPYVQAGYAVVFYSLDGPLSQRNPTDAQARDAYKKFRAAKAGVLNGRIALEFVLAKLPQVDPKRIFCAGHSSAGTLSLLLAEHEPRIKACIAYAPATDVESRLKPVSRQWGVGRVFPDLDDFLKRSSPKTHADKLNCPVFVFHARDDRNEPFWTTQKFVEQLKSAGKNVKFETVTSGGHYNSMIATGIPSATAWMKTLPGERQAARPPTNERQPPPSRKPPPIVRRPPNRQPPPSTRPAYTRVLSYQVLAYRGSGDMVAAAKRALAGFAWVQHDAVHYDARQRLIVIPMTSRASNLSRAKFALLRAGFRLGFTRVSSTPRR